MKKQIARMVLVCLSVVALTGGYAQAAAVTKNRCTVTKVGSDDRVFVDCSGQSFTLHGPGHSCGPHSSDGLRILSSLLTSALLSGKPVNINYENASPCAGTIYTVDLFSS